MKGDRQWLKDFVLRSDGASYEYDCCVKILRFGKDRLGTYAKVCIEEDGCGMAFLANKKGTKIRKGTITIWYDPRNSDLVDVVLLDQGKGLLPSVCVHPSDLFSLLYA